MERRARLSQLQRREGVLRRRLDLLEQLLLREREQAPARLSLLLAEAQCDTAQQGAGVLARALDKHDDE
jgi:hypothetical protein